MSRLTSEYLGLTLRSPIVASAGPVTARLDSLERLDSAGVGAVVLPSLFEEEITAITAEMHRMIEENAFSNAEALSVFPEPQGIETGPERYLELVASAKSALSVPVIASLNGATPGGWGTYASELEKAGADAVELNIYLVAADTARDQSDIERAYTEIVETVRGAVSIPIAVKLAPYFTSLARTAQSIVKAGANGLVLFNRFYQPDIDIDTREVAPDIALSSTTEVRLPLRWIGILHGQIDASLALSSGVHTSDEVAKALLVGADVVMSTSALIINGPEHVQVLEKGLFEWMDKYEYESVAQLRGSASLKSAADPSGYERSNYVQTIRAHTNSFATKFGQ